MNKTEIISQVEKKYKLFTDENLTALSLQRNRGRTTIEKMSTLLKEFIIIDINADDILYEYSKIDAYSQGRLAAHPLPDGLSARNIRKNDLWIAATTAATDSLLITTDKDFNHLKGDFLNIFCINFKKG